MMGTKPVYLSKTVWVNVLTGIVMTLTASDVLAVLPKDALPLVGTVVAVANIVLRLWFSDTKLV